MSDNTIQRLDDLIEIAENKEVKLLANILRKHIKTDGKSELGFNSKNDDKKPKDKKGQ